MELCCVNELISCSMHGQIVGEAKVECLVTILGYNWQLAALRQNLKYADIDLCVNWGQSYGLYKMFNKIWRMKAAIQLLLNFMYITLESRFAKLSWKDRKCLEESMETIMMDSPPFSFVVSAWGHRIRWSRNIEHGKCPQSSPTCCPSSPHH